MPEVIRFNISSAIILIGLFLGCLLAFFFIKKSWKSRSANFVLGLLIFSLTMIMLEGWLNYTGIIFKMLHWVNFSEPFNFAIAPLVYFFITRQLGDQLKRSDWLHAIPFVLWLVYSMFFYLQTENFKFNSIVDAMQLDIPFREWDHTFPDNPLRIRNFVNELTIAHLLIYLVVVILRLTKRANAQSANLFTTKDSTLRSIRNILYHFAVMFLVLVIIKATFKNDVGDYLLFIYLTFLLLLTTYHITNASPYFNKTSPFLEAPTLKYQSSSLDEDSKTKILNALTTFLKKEHYYLNANASIAGLSKHIGYSSHSVSQVINEKLNKSFFELIAFHRIEAAKRILKSGDGKKLTIEEISERVGYNSKSAFNAMFKKLTSQTPSSYRDS